MSDVIRAAIRDTLITLQDAQTTGNGKILAVPGFVHHVFYIRGNGTIGAGAITIETADDPEYAGTWAALPNVTDPPNANPITVTGDTTKIYSYFGKLAAVRARISTTVTTHTVTVTYKGGN